MNKLTEMWATTSGCNTDDVKLWSEQPKWDPCIKGWRGEGVGFSRHLPKDALRFLCQTQYNFSMSNALYYIKARCNKAVVLVLEDHKWLAEQEESLLDKLRSLVDQHEGES